MPRKRGTEGSREPVAPLMSCDILNRDRQSYAPAALRVRDILSQPKRLIKSTMGKVLAPARTDTLLAQYDIPSQHGIDLSLG